MLTQTSTLRSNQQRTTAAPRTLPLLPRGRDGQWNKVSKTEPTATRAHRYTLYLPTGTPVPLLGVKQMRTEICTRFSTFEQTHRSDGHHPFCPPIHHKGESTTHLVIMLYLHTNNTLDMSVPPTHSPAIILKAFDPDDDDDDDRKHLAARPRRRASLPAVAAAQLECPTDGGATPTALLVLETTGVDSREFDPVEGKKMCV